VPELIPRTPWQRVRPSRYGANLRTGDLMDEFPLLNGNNNWTGQNNFNNLWVRNLYVTDNLVVYDSYIDISATSAASLGVTDGYDFRLHSNNITRIQMLSGGVLVFTSSVIDGASVNITSLSDTFDRANAYPLDGWTRPDATLASAFQLSGNLVRSSAYNGAQNLMYLNGTTFSYGDVTVQASISGDGNSPCGVAARVASAAVTCYTWGVRGTQSLSLDYWSGGTRTNLGLSSVNAASAGFHTYKLYVSAGTTIGLSGFFDGVFTFGATHTLLSGGYQGLHAQAPSLASAAVAFNDFALLSTVYPLSAQDVVFGSSANLWAQAGTTDLGQWGYVTTDLLRLGYNTNVTISGVSKKFTVAEGTSAILPAATFGVVRLLSAVGTAGLSGVVGLSGVQLTVSAVGNDILVSGAAIASASAAWFYAGTGAAPGLMAIGDPASAGIFASAGGTLGFSTSGLERMRISSGGFIGLGTTNPLRRLVVAASGGQTNLALYNTPDTSAGYSSLISFRIDTSGSASASFQEVAAIIATYPDSVHANRQAYLRFFTANAGAATERLRIAPDGKIGINTTSAKETLDVAGTFQISAVTSANLAAASATRSGMIAVDLTASALIIYVGAARMSAAFAAF